jgi:uncharacterized membrane protein YwaF
MKWGSFGIVHIFSLLIAAGMNVGLYFLLKNKSDKVRRWIMFPLSFAGIAAILFNLLTWGSPLEYLPLHMCSITALLLPATVWTKNNVLGNLLLLWCLGALLALVVNTAQANFEIFSWTFFFYFFPHALEFALPILMFALGMVKFEPKYILSTIAITFLIYTGVHFINLAVNAYAAANNVLNPSGELVVVNYMYSLAPANPVLDLFWSIIPCAYWYMYLGLIVIGLYLGAIWLGVWLKRKYWKKA